VVIHAKAKVQEISGDTGVKEILLADGSKIPIAGVFIELGARGVMELAAHVGIQFDDEMKYIDTNKKMETNVPGVFAAGDICGPPWQMAKAVGEGCIAGIAAATYAKKMRSSD
jgi:thioredoxin reductase (NADPH)